MEHQSGLSVCMLDVMPLPPLTSPLVKEMRKIAPKEVAGAGAMLSARHAAERLQNCWHGGGQTIEQLRNSMQVCVAPPILGLHALCQRESQTL